MRNRREKNNVKIFAIGVVVLAAICLAAGIAGTKISEKPLISLKGKAEITVALNQNYKDEGATATLREKNISDELSSVGEVDTSKPGTYEIDYNINFRNKIYTQKRIVHVVDDQAPTVKLKGKKTIVVEKVEDYEEPGFRAKDNYDGDLTSKVESSMEEVNENHYVIQYKVSDSSGNETVVKRAVMIKDSTAPTIALKGEKEMTVKEGDKFQDPGATATDNTDGDLSKQVKTDGYVDVYRPGTYTITYTVKDSSGNVAETTRSVTVEDTRSNPKNAVYLTFDDGPSSDVTPQVLDILKENHIKATFFICNYDESNKHLVQRMVDEGHTVGIHGYSHNYAQIYQSVSAFMENIDKLKNKVKADTGYEPFVIRFPGGSSNTVSKHYKEGIMTELVQKVTEEGLMYLDWNISSGDAEGNNRKECILKKNVTENLQKNRSNVVLMHDISSKQTTADVLPKIIAYGKCHGYSFYPVSKDTVPIHHGVYN